MAATWGRHGFVGLVIAVLPACADGPPREATTVVGDTVVMESAVPVQSAPAQLEPAVRYGSVNDPEPAALVEVTAIAVGPDGSVFLYDMREGIKRFNADGDFAGWVARDGAGPGEVRYTTALAVGPRGEVAALDLGNRRVVVLERDGASRALRLPPGKPRYHEDALHYTANGTLRVGVNPPFTPAGEEPTPRVAYLEAGAGNGFVDTVTVPSRVWDRCPVRSKRRHRVGFWEDRRQPYVPKATWAIAPDGTLAVGCPDSYMFEIEQPDGSITRVRWAGGDRVPLNSDQQDFLSVVGFPALPEERPTFARLIVPGDGRVWVWPNQPMQKWIPRPEVRQRSGISEAWQLASTGAFEVFDEDGTWIGTVPLPDQVAYSGFPTEPPVVIRGDTIWAVTRDSLGVNYVTRFTVRWN